jgi:hypothetical protein
MGLDARVNPAEAAAHDVIGAVLLYEYQVAGRGLRVFATDDTTGSTSVIAPPHLRLQVAEAACQALLANGALAAMVTFQGRAEGTTVHPARGVAARFQIATRTRTVPLYLALGPNHQATLATLGKHTRRNLRYYRRRLESEVGAEFVPHASVGRDEFLELNRASTNPVPVALADWRYRSIARTPSAVLAGLRSRDGRWLSLIGGRRYLQEAEIDWQINLAGMPRYSLSTVMRSYMLEHEVAMGTSKLAFAGGTPHSMRHSFVDIYATDVIALRQSAAGRALRRQHPAAPTQTACTWRMPSQRMPPEIFSVCPVTYFESEDARYTAAGAISSGCPIRPSGVCATIPFSKSLPRNPAAWTPSVSTMPGLIAFTRIFFAPSSFDRITVIASTEAFVAV